MDIISYTAARNHFKDTMMSVCDNHEPIVITRQNEEPVVMMSLEDYNALQETLYLMSSPKNAERLLQGVDDVRSGNYQERDLIEE
jgi:antitoxin YefM